MNGTAQPSAPEPIRDEFPSPTMPTIFADGVTSSAPGAQVVKFFRARIEPHLRAENRTVIQPIVQVVMPLGGFLRTAFFFENISRICKRKDF